jgi:NADH:ubiquinone oxidoreductase subunit K
MMDYVFLSMTLLAIGVYCLLTKRQLLKVLISIELIATAATMNFVLLAPPQSLALGEAFVILVFSTDTCVTAIILALLLIMSKKHKIYDIGTLSELERSKEKENGTEGDD